MNKTLSVLIMSMTIWDQQGKLDEASFRKHLGRIKAAGAKTYIGSSASGDAFAMSWEEWDRVIQWMATSGERKTLGEQQC